MVGNVDWSFLNNVDGMGAVNPSTDYNSIPNYDFNSINGIGSVLKTPKNSMWSGDNLGSTLGGLSSILGNLGGLYFNYKNLGLMKDSLKFQKDAFNKNLNLQVKDYNNNLTNSLTTKYAMEGKSNSELDKVLKERMLTL